MYLLFVRHGVAVDRDLPIPDEERSLTPEGQAILREFFPQLVTRIQEMLDESGGVAEILSSPKRRARQTAEILAELSGWPLAEAVESLGNDDLDAFHEMLRQKKKPVLIIAVGHEPGLGRWTRLISGKRIRYDKGAAAALKIELDAKQFTGDFLWYIDAETDKPPGQMKRQRLREGFLEMEQEEERFLEQPEDPETVHKFRVRTRALRSLLSFYKPLLELKKKEYRRIQDALRQSGGRCARLREIDVLTEAYRERWQEIRPAENAESVFLKYLAKERKVEAKVLRDQIKEGSLKKGRKPAKRFIQGLTLEEDLAFEKKRMKEWRRRIDEALPHISQYSYEELHALRIRTKKARYVLEMLEYLLPRIREKEIERFKALQDELGALCDNHRHRDILAEMLRTKVPVAAKTEISSYLKQLEAEEHHIIEEIQD